MSLHLPCKEFIGCLNRGGYGVVRHNGKATLAHRVAYCQASSVTIESITGKVVRHACDNRKCIELSVMLAATANRAEAA